MLTIYKSKMDNRIGYIDAMRGLAMTFVVIGHVFYFSLCHIDNNIMRVLSEEIEVPLFFMVSGFLIKVPKSNYLSYIREKAFLLCVPAVIVMSVFLWVNDYDYPLAWVDSYKKGYWFTFALFQFVVVYTIIKRLFQAMKLSHISEAVLLILISVILRYVSVWCMREEHTFTLISLLGLIHFRSFIYFVMGTLVSKYILHNKQLNYNYIITNRSAGVIVLTCFILHLYTYKDSNIAYIGSSTLWLAVTTISGLFVILMGFIRYKSWSESRLGNLLQLIGRYSLDVYFIHYFFLPRNMAVIGEWFISNPNPIIEYTLAMAVAVVVIVASLLVGRIIRLSPILAHWLLAAKN